VTNGEDTGSPNDDPDDGPQVAVQAEAALQQRPVPRCCAHIAFSAAGLSAFPGAGKTSRPRRGPS
jgi:hypothetical protein